MFVIIMFTMVFVVDVLKTFIISLLLVKVLFLWGDHVHILHMHVGDGAVQGDRIMGGPWLAAWGA